MVMDSETEAGEGGDGEGGGGMKKGKGGGEEGGRGPRCVLRLLLCITVAFVVILHAADNNDNLDSIRSKQILPAATSVLPRPSKGCVNITALRFGCGPPFLPHPNQHGTRCDAVLSLSSQDYLAGGSAFDLCTTECLAEVVRCKVWRDLDIAYVVVLRNNSADESNEKPVHFAVEADDKNEKPERFLAKLLVSDFVRDWVSATLAVDNIEKLVNDKNEKQEKVLAIFTLIDTEYSSSKTLLGRVLATILAPSMLVSCCTSGLAICQEGARTEAQDQFIGFSWNICMIMMLAVLQSAIVGRAVRALTVYLFSPHYQSFLKMLSFYTVEAQPQDQGKAKWRIASLSIPKACMGGTAFSCRTAQFLLFVALFVIAPGSSCASCDPPLPANSNFYVTATASAYARYHAADWDATARVLRDSSGNGRHSDSAIGAISVQEESTGTNSAPAAFTYLSGDTASGIKFPQGSIPTDFTICSLTRYTGGVRRRILSAAGSNWLHGHFNGQRGVAYYHGWGQQGSTGATDDWLVMCGKNSVSPAFIVDGAVTASGATVRRTAQLTINLDSSGENSDWAVADILIWDRHLTIDEMAVVSDDLLAAGGMCPWRCNADFYESGGSCAACPGELVSLPGSTLATDCFCGANFYESAGNCTPCPLNKWSPAGSALAEDCTCNANFYESGGSCALCPVEHQVSPPGSTLVTDCICDANFYESGGVCAACPPGTLSPAGSSLATQCRVFIRSDLEALIRQCHHPWNSSACVSLRDANTGTISDMSSLFSNTEFNGDISKWNVWSVTKMSFMFSGASSFNGNIGEWDVSAVTDMTRMFYRASAFNGNLSNWKVSAVTKMGGGWGGGMFSQSNFNGDISKWDVSALKDVAGMFLICPFNQDLSKWALTPVGDLQRMFGNTPWNGDISKWDVSGITNMFGLFSASKFNGDISKWDVAAVTNMGQMFSLSTFNRDLSKWDVSGVTRMEGIFRGTLPFNGDISKWDVSAVTHMGEMFTGLFDVATQRYIPSRFNGDISKWDVAAVTNMNGMFSNSPFNGNISEWNVSRVNDMTYMFRLTLPFNGDISKWNVWSVTQMKSMFASSSINTDISKWDVSAVTTFQNMFIVTPFNQNLGEWVDRIMEGANIEGIFSGTPKLSFADVNECIASTDKCAVWATCQNTDGSYNCQCATATYGSCLDDYGCSARINATYSLQVTAPPGQGSAAYSISQDDYVGTGVKASAVIQFPQLPPVDFIGRATLLLWKAPGKWFCSRQTLAAVFSDILSGVPGSGIRRLQPFDPPVEVSIPVPRSPAGEALEIDVTSLLRAAAPSASLLLSDPNNCRSTFASSHHSDPTKRPTLRVEWAEIAGCDIDEIPHTEPGRFFAVEAGTLSETASACVRQGGELAKIQSQEDNEAAVAACSALPCWVDGLSAYTNYLAAFPTRPQSGSALWTRDGFWGRAPSNERLQGVCQTSFQGVDKDECALDSHSCSSSQQLSGCLSGLAHWYKLDPGDPLADSHGSTRMSQIPALAPGQMHHYSWLDCVQPGESCLHWNPLPTPPQAARALANNLHLQIPLDAVGPSSGLTVTFWYKRWTENKFGPRQRNLLCLRNTTAVDGNGENMASSHDDCIWSLVFTSALNVPQATQGLELHPAGVFSITEINILDVNRWYMVALVISAQNTATLYIDYQQVGKRLFLEWDASLYQSPNVLDLEMIQTEGRADIKVFSEALSKELLQSRSAYLTCPVGRCLNTFGSYVCECEGGYTRDDFGTCQDEDECILGQDNCVFPAFCQNNNGGFDCVCPDGLLQDSPYTCESNDPCARGNDNCHTCRGMTKEVAQGFATCTSVSSTLGTFVCECQSGWIGDGIDCRSLDDSELVMSFNATADGWIQPWPDNEPVELDLEGWLGGVSVSFFTSYLAIGGGPGKSLRMIIQFDHLPARISQANLELTHIWRKDPAECGGYTLLKFTAVDSAISEALDSQAAMRRLEEIPGVVFVTNAPYSDSETGRILIDISSFVAEAVPNGGRFALSVQRDPTSPLVCDDWFASSNNPLGNGPRLHVAYREARDEALDSTMALEPTRDGSIVGFDEAAITHKYEDETKSLDVGINGQVAVMQFDGIPLGVVAAKLVLSKSFDVSQDNSSCTDQYELKVVTSEVSNETGKFTTTTAVGGESYPVKLFHVRRIAVVDITAIVKKHSFGGRLGLLLTVRDEKCQSSFRSSRFLDDSHYGKVNVHRSERPHLKIQYAQQCGGCVFVLTTESLLARSPGSQLECDCLALGFAKLAISGIAPGAIQGLEGLETLDLADNNLAAVTVSTWHNLTSLRVLDLSDNMIKSVEPGAFSGMARLEKLWLQGNEIAVLPVFAFQGLLSLRVLSLSQNQIEFVELGAFKELQKVVWLDMSHNKFPTVDTEIWASMKSVEAISVANNNALQCIPVFPDTVSWADFSVTESGIRYFEMKPICLPYSCPYRPDLLLFSTAAFLLGETKPLHRGIEQVLFTARQDTARVLDQAHRQFGMHVARQGAKRCVCDGSAFCIDSSVQLKAGGVACSEDRECEAEKCCSGYCAALDQLDHRGSKELCANFVGCTQGYESKDGFRSCIDVNECVQRKDDCDPKAVCFNTPGSFTCSCGRGWQDSGDVAGLSCEDVDECKANPAICEESVEGSSLCTNTVGSFACEQTHPDYGKIYLHLEQTNSAPDLWMSGLFVGQTAEDIVALLKTDPYAFSEMEGAIIHMLILEFLAESEINVLRSVEPSRSRIPGSVQAVLRRSAFDDGSVAGLAVDLLPHNIELLKAAEIGVPLFKGAVQSAKDAGKVLRVHYFDAERNTFTPVETLGPTPNRLSLRARVWRFGLYVALAVCKGGTVPSPLGCSACDPGSAAAEGDWECTTCVAGEYAGEGSAACLPCPVNHYAGDDAAGICAPCDIGTFSLPGASSCTNCSTPGLSESFSCQCLEGYSGSSAPCTDDDECNEETDWCAANAECVNIPGSYDCVCNEGYIDGGGGRTCFHNSSKWSGEDVPQALGKCTEDQGDACHVGATCIPMTSAPGFRCDCYPEALGTGYGATSPGSTGGCSYDGFVVRVLQASGDVEAVKMAAGPCNGNDIKAGGSRDDCMSAYVMDHGGAGKSVNFLFYSKSIATGLAATLGDMYDARVYAWSSGTTGAYIRLPPSGMEVQTVYFEPSCALTGCWVLHAAFTVGHGNVAVPGQPMGFNTFYVPYAIGSDALSYDYGYTSSILDSYLPSNFPCRVSDYDGSESLPFEATLCCFGTPFGTSTSLGGDPATGVLGHYRTTSSFADFARPLGASADCSETLPEDKAPRDYAAALSFVGVGNETKFEGLPNSPGIVSVQAVDAYIGMYNAVIKLDEQELRTRAGRLKGTVGVEHTIDFFLGFANFKPATTTKILDSMATQTDIHVEKTSFFSVSTHGTNDYSFLEYVNMRLVAVYKEDSDFSGADESDARTVRTNSSLAAHYVQVTFTMGSQYDINSNSDLIPLDSVRAGSGTFFDNAGMLHRCSEWGDSSFPDKALFISRLGQACGPAAAMCTSPGSVADHFVSFNIPLGIDFFPAPAPDLSSNVFVHLVVSAVDTDARAAMTSPNAGEDPWQMKTTLFASIPVVAGGVNIFCDGITAKTDLNDVASAAIVVGSASSLAELSRLRIIDDVSSTQLDAAREVVIDSDSIEAGLLTLVIQGNASYFSNPSLNNRGVSLELEDVITIHLMESDGVTADGSGSEGKQDAVKALLAEPPDDNTNAITGLDTDGYALNGAFSFTVDRPAQRAHLEPSERLLAICPFNPPRPQVTGSVVMETCVIRRDVRYRDFPWRTGAVSTAMEISSSAYETRLETSSVESGFFTSIFGNSLYATQLAVDFATAIDEKYSLDGRSRRAFWINPGYEWSPTQTGGASLFQLSQRIFLFALVTLDERIASSPGKSIFDAPPFEGAPQDVNSDGASEAVSNLPKVPAARRRMLLTVDPTAGDKSTLSSAQVSFGVTRHSMMASAYGVPPDHVATFSVELQLTPGQECLGREELQLQIQSFLESHIKQSASAIDTVQVLSFSTPWTFGADCGARRAVQSGLTANVDMLVVFSKATKPVFDLASFSELPRINAITPTSVSNAIEVQAGSKVRPAPLPTSDADADAGSGSGSGSGSLNIGLVAGACGGALVLCLAAGAILYRRRWSGSEEVLATQTMVFPDVKASSAMFFANPAEFQRLEDASSVSSPMGSPMARTFTRSTQSLESEAGMSVSQESGELLHKTPAQLQDAIF